MKRLTPIKAIRIWCLDCEEGPKAVRNCLNTVCVFYSYRLGKNPNRKGIGPHKKSSNEKP